jgi:LysM repeat protein
LNEEVNVDFYNDFIKFYKFYITEVNRDLKEDVLMKKTYQLKNKKRFMVILLLFFLAVVCAGLCTAAALSVPPAYRHISVKPGDTLWEIADKYSDNIEIREYIYKIKKINSLEDATIYAGQKLYIP